MNQLNEITDEEFVPFLHDLGVDTYKKSFEWMLNDPDFSEVLRWLYKNLDHNNALTPREEFRYSELDKRQKILSETDLQSSMESIQHEYEGICLPGDQDKLIDVKLDINFQKERLQFLEKQDKITQDLIAKNKVVQSEVTLEISKLHAAQLQCIEDEKTESETCLTLAEEVETVSEDIVDIVTNVLNLMGRTQSEKDIAKMFYTFGPFEAYRQSQALFRSHFDLYTTKMFQNNRNDGLSDEELKSVLVEAKILEERLSDAVYAYIESKTELAGELSKLELVSRYTQLHPSQVLGRTLEAHSALGLARQQLRVAERHARRAAAAPPPARRRAVTRAARARAHTQLLAAWSGAGRLWALCAAARAADAGVRALLLAELQRSAARAHLAAELRAELRAEAGAAATRAESMNQIISEQALCEEKLKSNDYLVSVLSRIFALSADADVPAIVAAYDDLRAGVNDLKAAVEDGQRLKEDNIEAFVQSVSPLVSLVFSGHGRLPGGEACVGALQRRARAAGDAADARVLAAGAAFTNAKNGDKRHLRKLWQWFLAEPRRLPACPGIGAGIAPGRRTQ